MHFVTEIAFCHTASWNKETALVFVATEVALNRQEATPGHCQSCCCLLQDEVSCPISPFWCSWNSSLAFLSLLSGSQGWIQKKECQSWSPVTSWLSRFSFLTVRNFWTIVHDDWAPHFLWKPKGCTIAPGQKRRAGPAEGPISWCKPRLMHVHCLLEKHEWMTIIGFIRRGLNWLWISDTNCTQLEMH